MKHTNTLATAAITATILAFAMPQAGMADVTVTRSTDFGGIMGMGASKAKSTEYIKGDEKREERTSHFTGSILSKFSGPHTSVTIYRVDRGRIITLHPSNHTYSVLSMTPDNAETASGSQGGGKAQQQDGNSEKSHTRIVKNELTVKATGKRQTVSGYRCKEYLMTWLVITEDTRTRQRSKSVMTSDIWATPETRTLHRLKREEMSFNHAYLKRLGLEMSPQQQQQFGLSMLGLMSGRSQRDLKRAMRKIHGYPISISVKWETDAKGNGDSDEGGSSAGGAEALNSVVGGLGSMLGGMFGGHKEKSGGKQAGSQMHTIFDSTTTIIKVDTSSVSSRMFSIPAGYKQEQL